MLTTKGKGYDITEKNPANNPLWHLILIAKDAQGYKNLIKLVSIAYTEGFYYKPRIDYKTLEQYHEGLICCSACLGGEVLQRLQENKYEEAKAVAKAAYSNKKPVGPEIDKGKENTMGYYYHYHVYQRKKKGHVFFLFW